MEKILIVGLGEVGRNIYFAMKKEIRKKRLPYELYGNDVLPPKRLKINGKIKFSKEIIPADYYIISVYLTKQVFDVLNGIKKLKLKKKPLVSIESTIDPSKLKKLKEFSKYFDLVIFPHRYNPKDKEHHIFNLDRVIGGANRKSLKRAIHFFKKFMPAKLMHKTSFEIACISKPLENAYRYVEISVAEDLARALKKRKINFNELRKACNTKWNIHIKEALAGIAGKCLPKDLELTSKFLRENIMLKAAKKANSEYLKSLSKKELKLLKRLASYQRKI